MALDLVTTPSVGDATEASDYTRLRDNDKELAGAAAGVTVAWGGSLKDFVTATTETDLDDGGEWEVDGTHLAACEVYLEVNVKRGPDGLGGSVTVTVDLYNVTAGAQVASSPVAKALTTTTLDHGKSPALTLPTSVARFKARAKVSDATKQCAVKWRLLVRGS